MPRVPENTLWLPIHRTSCVGLAPTLWRRRGARGQFLLSGGATPAPLVVFLFVALFIVVIAFVVVVVVVVVANVVVSDLCFQRLDLLLVRDLLVCNLFTYEVREAFGIDIPFGIE